MQDAILGTGLVEACGSTELRGRDHDLTRVKDVGISHFMLGCHDTRRRRYARLHNSHPGDHSCNRRSIFWRVISRFYLPTFLPLTVSSAIWPFGLFTSSILSLSFAGKSLPGLQPMKREAEPLASHL